MDENAEALRLTRSNVKKFNAEDVVQIIQGKAPEAILNLPKLDAVLVGGTKNLRELLQACLAKLKPEGRIVVNAILLETAATAVDELKKLDTKDVDVASVSVAKGRDIGSGTIMLARNPITIVSATKA